MVKQQTTKLNNMKKSITTIIAIASLSCSAVFARTTLEQELIEASKQINARLPMMTDSATRVDSTYAVGNRLTYMCTVLDVPSKSAVDPVAADFVAYIKPILVNRLKTNPAMKNSVYRTQLEFGYMFAAVNGEIFADIVVSPKDF
jgi:hypothetical protein